MAVIAGSDAVDAKITAYAVAVPSTQTPDFNQHVQPLFSEFCFGCQANRESSGNLSFDSLVDMKDSDVARENWYRVLKQLRAGLMSPAN